MAILLSAAMTLQVTGITSMAETVSSLAKPIVQRTTVRTASDPDAEPATPSDATYVSNEEELIEAVKTSGEIVLTQKIELSKRLVVFKDVEISGESISCAGNIVLNEETEEMKGTELIYIAKDAKVTLQNIVMDATGLDCLLKINDDMYSDYYAIGTGTGSKLVLNNVSIICQDEEDKIVNLRKRGLGLGGECEMNSGSITGFPEAGVRAGNEFIMNGGEISGNGIITGNNGGVLVSGKNKGKFVLNDGYIFDNSTGVLNSGTFEMNGGEIHNNTTGLSNLNKDVLSGEKFFPKATIRGGSIGANEYAAVINRERGTVVIDGNAEILGNQIESEILLMTESAEARYTKFVILNQKKAELQINGGSIFSNASNEVAIYNDSTSKIVMMGGEIWSTGNHSVVIRNENVSSDAVKILGGSLGAIGNGSQLLDSQGSIEIADDVVIAGEEDGQYLIRVSHGEGGTVTPDEQIAAFGENLHFVFTPDAGYKIEDVKVDGGSKGARASYDLKVKHRHTVEVTFVKKTGSSSSSGGGSSSGESSHSSAPKKETASTPETPGAWQQDQNGWRMIDGSGFAYSNTWVYKNAHWYWIGTEGYMFQGWNLINGKWFYLSPATGEMKTGWIQDGEKWYYLNDDGSMAVNTTTIDGYRVNDKGEWIS